jgi:hypothetical protein
VNARKYNRGTRRPRTHRVGPRPRLHRVTKACAVFWFTRLLHLFVPAADVPPRAGLTGTGRSAPLGTGSSARPEGAAGATTRHRQGACPGEPGRPTDVSRDGRGGG